MTERHQPAQTDGSEQPAAVLEKLKTMMGDRAAAIRFAEPMSLHTTFRIGGPADFFYEPDGEADVAACLSACRKAEIPVTLIGRGSNLVVADRGIRGMVLSLGERFSNQRVYRAEELCRTEWFAALNGQDIRGDLYFVEAEAGRLLSDLSAENARLGLAGTAFACGIPGTLGGAVFMNAGAYGASMSDAVIAVRYLAADGAVRVAVGENLRFGYRHSVFREQPACVLSALLMLHYGHRSDIQAEMNHYTALRSGTQPLEYPSAGSVFKRPVGHYTGKLITDCGLKGCRLGGAQVSVKHAGFIVNVGGALAADVIALVRRIRETVQQETGVTLETEIRFIGDYTAAELAVIGLEPERPQF